MLKLLLADDSTAIQRLVALTFSQEDIDVTAVSDGEEAIARISADPPDVVLADIAMPKRSGYDVAAFIKEQPRFAKIPVLLLAGAFEPVDEARAAQVHCDGVLVKPFEPQQVIARVRELLGQPSVRPVPAPPPLRAVERPAAPLKAVQPKASPADDSLESYFDRLDAAFATLDAAPSSARDEIDNPIGTEPLISTDFDLQPPDSMNQPLSEPDVSPEVPTVDRLLGLSPPLREPHRPAEDSPFAAPRAAQPESPTERPQSSAPQPSAPQAVPQVHTASIAEAFSALLAVEQGEPGAQPVRLAAAAPTAITDAMVEEIARRVLERLSSEALRPIVAEIVSNVSERLVREEIDRIRKQS